MPDTRRTITKLESNPTKEQEVAFLSEVRKSIPSNSYLASLITDEIVTWFAANVRNDVPSDLLALIGEYGADLQHAMSDLAESRRKVLTLTQEVDKQKARGDLLERKLNEQQGLFWGSLAHIDGAIAEAKREASRLR